MKTISFYLSLSFCAFLFSSCVYYEEGYGYGSRGYNDRVYGGYGYGRSSRAVCTVCGYNPCRCGRSGYPGIRRSSWGYHDGYDHYHDRYQRGWRHPDQIRRERERQEKEREYKIVSGSVGTKTKPQGYHSIDWYRSRGYDLSKVRLENRGGDRYGRSSGSSSSSSSYRSSSSSGSSKKSSSSSSSRSSSSSSKKSSSSSYSRRDAIEAGKKRSGITGGAAGTGRAAMRQ